MKQEQAKLIHAQEAVGLIQETIAVWHTESEKRNPDDEIVTEQIRNIRSWNEHRTNMAQIVQELAATNTEIWHEEDKVRSLKDDIVLKAIRNINPLNQHRNDLIEELDELMADYLEQNKGGVRTMETIGSLIDKLSINELKIYHMEEQGRRPDVNERFRKDCENRLSILILQRHDLQTELQELMDEVLAGKKKFQLYRQMKMYNEKRFKD